VWLSKTTLKVKYPKKLHELRSKIDKAIEEIEKIIEGGNHADDYLDGFDDGVENAIEILKRNIGE